MKQLTVVIVNYRVKYFLEQTLRSVQEAMVGITGDIIVIDNNSGDDSIEFLRSRFSDVIFVENTDNVGFARANNQGIALAQSQYTLILNPDTIISEHSIRKSIHCMETNPDCGGIGVKMLDGNGVFLPESKRSFPSPWVSFCKIFGLSVLFPYSPRFAKYHLKYLDNSKPHVIDILAGAYMFIRTDLLKNLGGFDEDFFMYGEDIDLSYRIVKSGYRNYYLPVSIIHYKGESTKKDSMKYVKVFYEAMLIFFRKHYPHYSSCYSVMIRGAVIARAGSAILKRVILKPLKPLISHRIKPSSKWIIISEQPNDIINILAEQNISTENISHNKSVLLKELSASCEYDIIIDDKFTYKEIIDIIEMHAAKNIRFHIYSNENRLIISPKMQII